MKQTPLFLIITILLFSTACAQDYPLQSALMGVKGGANFSTVYSENIDDLDFRTDFYAGLAVEAMLTDKFGFQVEAFYSRQGFKSNESLQTEKIAVKIDYIQFPILAKAYLLEGLNIQGGIQLGFKIDEEVNNRLLANDVDPELDAIRNFDFQLASGIEYKFKNGFFIQARYSYGLSEIIDDLEVYSSVLSVGVGFMIY
ncbi:porin family protein [uncultured Aquimarina sp.]|uniref:porin family protein n=1 Tax=uncultured Aquimarina sp. TaxID=575652 RepID=UPI00262E4201|nr:porin family protein [uncultured Aquimarina sp.]